MAGQKHCSTAVLDAMLYKLSSAGGGNLVFGVVTSSDLVPTIAGCSSGSTGFLVRTSGGVGGDYPTTNYFLIATSSSGRCVIISACSCDAVLQDGRATQIILFNDASEPIYQTTCTSQDLTAGNKVNIGSWVITINQPT